MTKTAAADMVAREAIRFAQRTGQPVTKLAIQEAASTMWHCGAGTFGRAAADAYNYKTAYRAACVILRNLDRADLIGK